MAQPKQLEKLILTDNRNIFTNRFQTIQRLQANFMTDGIRNFMYTKHNGNYAKLKIFSFIPQRQCKQPNFMNDSIRISYIPSNQTYKHSPNNQNNDINMGFTTN